MAIEDTNNILCESIGLAKEPTPILGDLSAQLTTLHIVRGVELCSLSLPQAKPRRTFILVESLKQWVAARRSRVTVAKQTGSVKVGNLKPEFADLPNPVGLGPEFDFVATKSQTLVIRLGEGDD